MAHLVVRSEVWKRKEKRDVGRRGSQRDREATCHGKWVQCDSS